MKIRYKGAALRDIKQKQDYIGNILHNKQAGQKLTESILCAVSLLADNPSMGVSLSSKYDVDFDLRFLIVSKQLVFYRIEDETQISVVRILDGRQDYMSILFD
ncbi:type II toxin-antitoxin system RelE/ParE family toxin [Pseudoflavonifractor sp. 60]|uniref:type II toxin-antitoxin system RelE/ParE family toxin n=1 Tax=Pseudoflavonifractor sp. 60 TaxID=2304576 RepID=UPI001369FCA3|nr:type II toxin-antitoxin system RelE/ParE family toxin [Pseudoflavonifractor sp. 60]NBI69221.1 type II toxin-antitoxin system RelE/ParE family toxin [Pseudoflavonifractor sp. 60]